MFSKNPGIRIDKFHEEHLYKFDKIKQNVKYLLIKFQANLNNYFQYIAIKGKLQISILRCLVQYILETQFDIIKYQIFWNFDTNALSLSEGVRHFLF